MNEKQFKNSYILGTRHSNEPNNERLWPYEFKMEENNFWAGLNGGKWKKIKKESNYL